MVEALLLQDGVLAPEVVALVLVGWMVSPALVKCRAVDSSAVCAIGVGQMMYVSSRYATRRAVPWMWFECPTGAVMLCWVMYLLMSSTMALLVSAVEMA